MSNEKSWLLFNRQEPQASSRVSQSMAASMEGAEVSRYFWRKMEHKNLWNQEAIARFHQRLGEHRRAIGLGHCIYCKHYLASIDNPGFGNCRRYAPGQLGTFPDVEGDDKCGDYEEAAE